MKTIISVSAARKPSGDRLAAQKKKLVDKLAKMAQDYETKVAKVKDQIKAVNAKIKDAAPPLDLKPGFYLGNQFFPLKSYKEAVKELSQVKNRSKSLYIVVDGKKSTCLKNWKPAGGQKGMIGGVGWASLAAWKKFANYFPKVQLKGGFKRNLNAMV